MAILEIRLTLLRECFAPGTRARAVKIETEEGVKLLGAKGNQCDRN